MSNLNSVIDTSLRLRSILSKYEVATQGDPKNVWKVLNNKSILSDDIDRLVYILGVTYEQRIIIPNNRHHRSNRYFKCND